MKIKFWRKLEDDDEKLKKTLWIFQKKQINLSIGTCLKIFVQKFSL